MITQGVGHILCMRKLQSLIPDPECVCMCLCMCVYVIAATRLNVTNKLRSSRSTNNYTELHAQDSRQFQTNTQVFI